MKKIITIALSAWVALMLCFSVFFAFCGTLMAMSCYENKPAVFIGTRPDFSLFVCCVILMGFSLVQLVCYGNKLIKRLFPATRFRRPKVTKWVLPVLMALVFILSSCSYERKAGSGCAGANVIGCGANGRGVKGR